MSMPIAAQRARQEALKRHRREVRWWKLLAVFFFVQAMLGVCTVIYLLDEERHGWHTDKPMPMQRLTVVTEGFMDKQGNWRSFDNGEKITVKQWRP